MDKKVYVWLFNNISRYEFRGDEANQVKTSISRMLVTDDSINSDVIISKMQELYSRFCELFYNNILGYQNGLAISGITSSELDCYLIHTSDGMVPIGYYRMIRPAEAASMVQRYLDRCKNDINSERNSTVVKWQNSIDEIAQKYELIKNSKNPNVVRMVLGIVLVLGIAVMSVVSLLRINPAGVMFGSGDGNVLKQALSGIPVIAKGSLGTWIGYLAFIVFALAAAAVGAVFTIREIRLIIARNTTKNILNGILSYVTRLEQGVINSVENDLSVLYDAARKGENAEITPNANISITENVSKRIKTADEYVGKNEVQRKGIGYVTIVLLAIIALIFPLSYSRGVAEGIESMQTSSSTSSTSNSSSSDKASNTYSKSASEAPQKAAPAPAPVQPEKPKVSSYEVYKSDVTWLAASKHAEELGGHLVCINDSEEFEKVCQKADEQNIKVFWVGAYRRSFGKWDDVKWEDGKSITFAKWLPGEPTYYSEDGEEENYLMVFNVNGTWYFNDAINDVSKYYTGRMGYIVETEE